MPEDVDLFADAPPLKRCDGCGRYFEEQELKKCRICGEYFCPECRRTHDCRVKPNAGTVAQQQPAYAPPAPAQTSYVRPPENPYRPAPQPAYAAPEPAPVYREPEPQPAPRPAPVYIAPEIPLDNPESAPVAAPAQTMGAPGELQCSECGRWLPKSMLSQCHKCGAIVCRDCRTKHKCPPKKKAKKANDDFAEPNLANEKRQKMQRGKRMPEEDSYDSIMNFRESKKKRSSGKNNTKKIILFVGIGIAAAALVFVLLNLFGVLTIIPGLSGLLAGGTSTTSTPSAVPVQPTAGGQSQTPATVATAKPTESGLTTGGSSGSSTSGGSSGGSSTPIKYGDTTVTGDWKGYYNGKSGTISINDDGTGYIKGSDFLGISGRLTPIKWSKDDAGNYMLTSPGMSNLAPGPFTVSGGSLQLTLENGDKIELHR